MASYSIEMSRESIKFLKKTDTITKERILEAIKLLAINPYAYTGTEKLKGSTTQYRIRIGKYRVVYTVKDCRLVIMVLNIDSRGGVYK